MSVYPAALPTVRPAVRSAFEQGSGGGAASIIAGLFAQGQQGFWHPFTDFASLSQDAAGTLPYTALEQPVGRVLDRSGRGNHASQVTSTARGVVSARVNQVIGVASAPNGWIPQSAGVGSAGVIAANTPEGADNIVSIQLRLNGGSTTGDISQIRIVGAVIGLSYKATFQIRTTDAATKTVGYSDSVSILSTTVNGEWKTVEIGPNVALTTAAVLFFLRGGLGHSDSADIDVRRVSFVLANQASLPYQRVNTPTDYDSVGFPKYLRLDGTDDFYTCAGGGSTTGFYYSDVIRPMGGAGTGRLLLSDRIVGSTGYIVSLSAANKLQVALGGGGIYTLCVSTDSIDVGNQYFIEAFDDGVNLQVVVNGGTPVTVPRPATPTYGGSAIMLYKNTVNNDSIYNGQITEPIYRAGPPPNAYERSVIRAYQMQKAGMA